MSTSSPENLVPGSSDPDRGDGGLPRFWTVNVAAWLVITVTSAAFMRSLARGDEAAGVVPILIQNLVGWLPWIGVTGAVVRTVRHLRDRHATRLRAAGALALLGLAWLVIYSAYLIVAWILLHDLPAGSWRALWADRAGFWLYYDAGAYLTVVAVAYWAETYHRFVLARRRESALAAEVSRAELAALRSQLDPHFLFNTLNAVSALVRTGRSDAALRSISRLGSLLRTTLDAREATLVPLSDDVAFAIDYLELQRLRFGNRLHTEVEVDPAVETVLAPGMLLQPLVENAIRHGAPGPDGRIHVRVEARLVSDRVRIDVVNHRSPTSETSPTGDARERGAGLALENLRERLRLLFGDAARFGLEDLESDLVRARVEFPARAADTVSA